MTKSILLTVSLFVFMFSSLANAGMRCTTDWRGEYVCVDNGYTTRTKRDWQGYDTTTDNRGNSMRCKTDWRGDYVCN
jgi:hypothetical protein